MFCNQCEQTSKGFSCTVRGNCGKGHELDVLQDLLIYVCAGLSEASLEAEKSGSKREDHDFFLLEAIFSTLTNVNFDPVRIKAYIEKAIELREEIKHSAKIDPMSPWARYKSPKDMEELIKEAEEREIEPTIFKEEGEDVASLKLTILYGLKGIAAYAYHAYKLGVKNEEVLYGLKDLLVKIFKDRTSDVNTWVQRALEVGRLNLLTMEALDRAHTSTFGNPVPTKVPTGFISGKAILISGHDLKDLYELLKQTEGKGIYVYTHGEMLPAHGYPELKKFPHLYGHYGKAWQNQQKEFEDFPGPIVMTTNCLMPPKNSYSDKVFTLGPVGYPGLKHINNLDFSSVIEAASNMKGFYEDRASKEVVTGFARNACLSVADKIIELVKTTKIRHFFLVGGCDGAKPARNYYTELVEKIPHDCVVLTLGCGKFRFFDQDLGTIDGIPRLLDIGQCNDAYSAIQIALALSKAFGASPNDLPLSLILSWYEQKAVAILLTLLHLGIKNIRLGPSMPAFLTKNVANFIVENYNLKPITNPDQDLSEILG